MSSITLGHQFFEGDMPESKKTEDRLANEVKILIGRVIEVTASTLSLATVYILLRPELQSRLRDEVKDRNYLEVSPVENNGLVEHLTATSLMVVSRLIYGVMRQLSRVFPDEDLRNKNYFIPAGVTSLAKIAWAGCQDNADGFASLNGGTTGGNGGTVVTVKNQADLERYAQASGKYVIKIPGRITITPTGKEVEIANDKTIIGEGASGEIYGGGFKIISKKNVIIRNLRIGNTNAGEESDWDGIQVDTSSNIWIDHCIFEFVGDGSVDLRKDTTFYTVSNTWFKEDNKAFGIGWTENVIGQGTMHHNYFDKTNQRNPSCDNQKYAHMYNNYIRGVTSYGHYARGRTNMRMENCFFEGAKNPVTKDSGAILNASGNVYKSCSGTIAENSGSAFSPSSFYKYTLDPANNVPGIVKANVGPRASVCPPGDGSTNPPPASTTTNPVPTSNPNPGTVPQWGQCGGQGWTGGTTCQSPFKCNVVNEWYSQCI
ncbi:polysaccharide lyase family 1 protein [Paramyrothecium foliicola]|nr:polysaccharide lyase family 1 protein [Paramyrothecium foliicola]